MSLQLDCHKTALVLIDLQYGIVNLPVQPHAAGRRAHGVAPDG
jgi:hypothetical protein